MFAEMAEPLALCSSSHTSFCPVNAKFSPLPGNLSKWHVGVLGAVSEDVGASLLASCVEGGSAGSGHARSYAGPIQSARVLPLIFGDRLKPHDSYSDRRVLCLDQVTNARQDRSIA